MLQIPLKPSRFAIIFERPVYKVQYTHDVCVYNRIIHHAERSYSMSVNDYPNLDKRNSSSGTRPSLRSTPSDEKSAYDLDLSSSSAKPDSPVELIDHDLDEQAMERRIVRRLDTRMLPMLAIVYFVSILDR